MVDIRHCGRGARYQGDVSIEKGIQPTVQPQKRGLDVELGYDYAYPDGWRAHAFSIDETRKEKLIALLKNGN